MKDGFVLAYVQDNRAYPVAMTKEQIELLQRLSTIFEPVEIINECMGEVVDSIVRMGEDQDESS